MKAAHDCRGCQHYCLSSSAGEKASLAQEVYALDSDWLVPELWSHEFLNVLASNVKFGGISLDQANNAWENGRYLFGASLQPINHKLALAFAVEYQISVYDAQYVTLAQSMACPLLTEDAKLCDKVPETAVRMTTFIASQETN